MGGRKFAHSKFYIRFPVDLGIPQAIAGLAEYRNVPRTIGAVVSARLATLVELDTVLGLSDLYDLLEIMSVDGYNQRLLNKRQADAHAH